MRYFGSYGGLQSFFFLALRFDGLTNTMSLVRVFVSDVSLGEVCDRSKDKPVANPWLCGDRVMVYVDVSNSECPVLQNCYGRWCPHCHVCFRVWIDAVCLF